MIGQKSITSFFSPTSKKRNLEELNTFNDDAKDDIGGAYLLRTCADRSVYDVKEPRWQNAPDALEWLSRYFDFISWTVCAAPQEAKKQKKESSDVISSPSPSPEQLERIAKNKAAALVRLNSHQHVPDGIGESWKKALNREFGKEYFKSLMSFVGEERKKHTIYPPPHEVFTWTQMCDLKDVKVVILGQDPYHGPNQAHGLCFSVQRPVPPPPSLINMFKELASDIEGFEQPGHGNLTGWAKQGVLLLNAVLTVRAHQANSHKDKGWEMFTDAVVQWLNANSQGLVFILWGSYAQKKGAVINKKRHHVLQAVHPSPLSAHRGFFGCKHFSKTNELLTKSGKEPVDWKAL